MSLANLEEHLIAKDDDGLFHPLFLYRTDADERLVEALAAETTYALAARACDDHLPDEDCVDEPVDVPLSPIVLPGNGDDWTVAVVAAEGGGRFFVVATGTDCRYAYDGPWTTHDEALTWAAETLQRGETAFPAL